MTNPNHGRTVSELFTTDTASTEPKSEGRDGPVGPQACARVSVATTHCDDKWASAVNAWDRIRALVRKLPTDQQTDAWQLAHDALTELAADLRQQFFDSPRKEATDGKRR